MYTFYFFLDNVFLFKKNHLGIKQKVQGFFYNLANRM